MEPWLQRQCLSLKLLFIFIFYCYLFFHDCDARKVFPFHSKSKVRIDKDGFLSQKYEIHGDTKCQMLVRQVPGDGSCLFHALNVCLSYVNNGSHPKIESRWLIPSSQRLRDEAVDCLSKNPSRILVLENNDSVTAGELVEAAAQYENTTVPAYISIMRRPTCWGGGPEIVALANTLERPIHVYELICKGKRFCFHRMARFGSPWFDHETPLHILSADSRFPDLDPGQQLPNGNHFLALFPTEDEIRNDSSILDSKFLRRDEMTHNSTEKATWISNISRGFQMAMTNLWNRTQKL